MKKKSRFRVSIPYVAKSEKIDIFENTAGYTILAVTKEEAKDKATDEFNTDYGYDIYKIDTENIEVEKISKGSKIKSHIYREGKKVDFKKIAKEQLRSDYPLRDTKWVWDNWTPEQRYHFVYDHSNFFVDILEKKSYNELSNTVYSRLPQEIKDELQNHIQQGRYAEGDKVSGQKNYEAQLHNLRDDKVFRIKIKGHGVEIKEYETGDAFTHTLTFTKAELLSLLMESWLKSDATEEDLVEVISGYTKYLLQNKK